VVSAEVEGDALEVIVEEGFANHGLLRHLLQGGFEVDSLVPVARNLTDVFMRLTGPRAEAG
jgi:hypothetical protein